MAGMGHRKDEGAMKDKSSPNALNNDKSMTTQTETESPQPVAEAQSLAAVASTDLLAFSSILGGLLASGHYTEKVAADEYGDVPHGLLTDDYGKNWREDMSHYPGVTRRYMPVALQTAEMLWKDMKHIIQANPRVRHGEPDASTQPAAQPAIARTDLPPQC